MLLVRSEPRWSCRPSAASDQNGDRRIQQAVFASPDAVRAFQILTSCTRQCWQCSEVIKLWLAQSLGPNCDTRIEPECLVLWSPGIADELSGDALCTVCAFQTLHLAAPRSQLMTELQSGFLLWLRSIRCSPPLQLLRPDNACQLLIVYKDVGRPAQAVRALGRSALGSRASAELTWPELWSLFLGVSASHAAGFAQVCARL